MQQHLCLFGNTPELSLLELQQFFPEVVLWQENLALIAGELVPQDLLNKLGGTVKIFTIVHDFANQDEIEEFLTPYFVEQKIKKFNIINKVKNFSFKVQAFKEDLGLPGLRYIKGQEWGLSASVLLHQKKVVELLLIQQEDKIYLAQTSAIQNIDDWTKRDRMKPYADHKKGMLPPKVAKMMVNLVASELVTSDKIYDPFCGSGTILMEALALGYQVVGSDLDADSITGSDKNLAWLCQEYSLPENFTVFQSDASDKNLKQKLNNQLVDAIVTEPFLGRQTPDVKRLPQIFDGLERLYLGAFKNWRSILKPGAKVVIIFPKVVIGKASFALLKLIDKLASLGYNVDLGPIDYAREGAIVKREIYIFKYVTR